MQFYIENESDITFPFSIEEMVEKVACKVLEVEECPYEVTLNVLITDKEGIRNFNREYRNIDKETDVLSFPNLDFEGPSDFEIPREREMDYFDPDSGELILGDVIINGERVYEQAESYGHSVEREFAFLLAHSMYHLCGYDHMVPQEAENMEKKQEKVLELLGITREM